MVEGSGFLQWLTVLSITLDPRINLVLLDEPDAHLHSALQQELLIELNDLSDDFSKQILYSTHSSELIKHQEHSAIIDANSSSPDYINTREQKVSILAVIGSEYTPRLAEVESKKRILFLENGSDARLLSILSETIETKLGDNFVIWPWASGHKERLQFYLEMRKLIPDLKTISLVDRDMETIGSVELNLTDKSYSKHSECEFYARKWRRRHIEGYLLHPDAIARAASISPDDVIAHVSRFFALDLSGRIVDQSEPEVLLQSNAKDIILENSQSLKKTFNISKYDIAKNMRKAEIPQDIKNFINEVRLKLA